MFKFIYKRNKFKEYIPKKKVLRFQAKICESRFYIWWLPTNYSDGNILYHDFAWDYTVVYNYKNSSICIFKFGEIYWMLIIPQ